MQLAREGRCDAALPDLATARAAAPDDVAVLELSGLCELRLHRYADAATTLESALRVAPQRADLSLALAMARFHAGDLDGAEQALAGARALESDAEYQLYLGMLRLERRDYAGAATALARARELDAKRVDPVASYYLGLAQARIREDERAQQTLIGVRDVWAGTVWGDRRRARSRGSSAGRRARPSRRSVRASSTTTTRCCAVAGCRCPPTSAARAASPASGMRRGSRAVEARRHDARTDGHFRGATYVDLTDFDVHFPGATLWLETPVGESSTGRLRYDFGYAWQGGDPFFATNAVQASLEHPWSRYGTAAVYVQGLYDAYFFNSQNVPDGPGTPDSACADPTRPCGPSNLNERNARERDGAGWAAGFDHTCRSRPSRCRCATRRSSPGFAMRLRVRGPRVRLRRLRLPRRLRDGPARGARARRARRLQLVPTATRRRSPIRTTSWTAYSTELSNRQREKTTRVEIGLARSFGPSLTIGGHFRYLDNQSTVDVFDYDQYVVGMTVTLTFQREL